MRRGVFSSYFPTPPPTPVPPPLAPPPEGSISSSSSDAEKVYVSFQANEPIENWYVWNAGKVAVQGFYAGATPPYIGHDVSIVNGLHTIGLKKSIEPFEPGTVPLRVTLHRNSSDPAKYLDATVNVAGQSSPFILPTVPSDLVVDSVIPRTLFNCYPADITADSLALHAAGITHLTMQLFASPVFHPELDTADKCDAYFETHIRPNIDFAGNNGFGIVGNLDDTFRYWDNILWMHHSDIAEEVMRRHARKIRDTGIVWGIDVIDEAWHDPDVYGPEEFCSWWAEENGPPLAWPTLGTVIDHSLWEVPNLSGYASRYPTWQQWARWDANGHSVWETLDSANYQTGRRGANVAARVPAGWKWIATVGINGPYYDKWVPGGDYNPNGDRLQGAPNRPQGITTQIFLALADGCSGFKVYGYDWALWRNQRASAIPGVILPDRLQTGAKPGDDRWAKMREALLWIEANKVELTTGTLYEPTQSGPWVFGRRGNLVWGINTSERALPSPLPGGIVVGQISESSTVPGCGVIVWNHA